MALSARRASPSLTTKTPQGRRISRLVARQRGVSVASDASVTLYEVLQVAQGASREEIKTAYRRLALQLHPDVNSKKDTTAQFLQCKLAYEILYSDGHRHQYDQQLNGDYCSGPRTPPRPASPQPPSAPPHASVAAAAVSSGLALKALSRVPGSRFSNTDSPAATASPFSALPDPGAAASLRSALFHDYAVVLEQFASMAEALEFLREVQESFPGDASCPRGQGPGLEELWQQHTSQGGVGTADLDRNNSSHASGSAASSSRGSRLVSVEDQAGGRPAARYGGWHPGRFAPRSF